MLEEEAASKNDLKNLTQNIFIILRLSETKVQFENNSDSDHERYIESNALPSQGIRYQRQNLEA